MAPIQSNQPNHEHALATANGVHTSRNGLRFFQPRPIQTSAERSSNQGDGQAQWASARRVLPHVFRVAWRARATMR
eukprot:4604945-Alexandrium_andersonii.AAC.1